MSRFAPIETPVHSRTMIPMDSQTPDEVLGVWQSREYLATLWVEVNGQRRLTVNRTQLDRKSGSWREGVSWDALQLVKSQCGFGDWWAVEVYPPDAHVVDVAAMRHLWLLPGEPEFGWKRG